MEARLADLPRPPAHEWTGPFDLLVAGVGGTGIVTVGAIITMAANLENKSASVLDFMGFAQKGGMVLSYVRLADVPERLNQVRIDTQQADAILACDMVVGASADALQTAKRGRTRIIANTHEIPTAAFVQNPYASIQASGQLEKMRFAAGPDRVVTFDAQAVAEHFLGDTIFANILLMGFTWQSSLVPVSLEAMLRAIELNGTAVEQNKTAFALGRLAAAEPTAITQLMGQVGSPAQAAAPVGLDALIEHRVRLLTGYQNARYAARYRDLVEKVREAERKVVAPGARLAVTEAVAHAYAKLLAYKDEYEVGRLYTNGKFERDLKAQFDGDLKLSFHLAPPLVSRSNKDGGGPRKMTFGPWILPVFRALAAARFLRGTPLDPFGYMLERRMERQLAEDYARTIRDLLPKLATGALARAEELAALPDRIRGFGHVKIANLRLVKRRERELADQLGLTARMGSAVNRLVEEDANAVGLNRAPVPARS